MFRWGKSWEHVEAEYQIKTVDFNLPPAFIYETSSLQENWKNYTVKLYKEHLHPQGHQVLTFLHSCFLSPCVSTQMYVCYFFLAIDFKKQKCLLIYSGYLTVFFSLRECAVIW